MDAEKSISARAKVAALTVALVLATGLSVKLIFAVVEEERQRAEEAWQHRLAIVANSRADAVSDWVDDQLGLVAALGRNPSLQLYANDLAANSSQTANQAPDQSPDRRRLRASQAAYVRSLLSATAGRGGFDRPLSGPDVQANVVRRGLGGMALADSQGRVLVATAGLPDVTDEFAGFLLGVTGSDPNFYDMRMGANAKPIIGVASAVYGVQSDPETATPIGYVFGLREVGSDLFGRLDQPGDLSETGQTFLVRRRGERLIEYLSPLAGGFEPLSLSVPIDQRDVAAHQVAEYTGAVIEAENYQSRRVLATGRAIANTNWTLVRSVEWQEAMGPSEARLRRLAIWLVLGVLVLGAGIGLIWRHGASVRVDKALAQARGAAEDSRRISDFLEIVTDRQSSYIATVDADGRYTFANEQAAREAGITKAEMLGKTLAGVLGPASAAQLDGLNRRALDEGRAVAEVLVVEDAEGRRTLRSNHIPMSGNSPGDAAVLIVQEDITALVSEREERERNLRALTDALVEIIDRRDPYSAMHSGRVSEVVEAVASEMDLPPAEIETVRMAGSLMNLGKILVPRDLLTKTDSLSREELDQIRGSILGGAELLDGIRFDGPVVETIRQAQERWDGSGMPEGLAGEQIILPARIVSVANAFVGMISPRAYRDAIDIDSAVSTLMSATGTFYDRAVIAALTNFLDNRGGRELWTGFGHPSSEIDA